MPDDGFSTFRIAVLGLILLDGKILLIQESKSACRNKWFLPGGRISRGESISEATLREVREESGLDVELTGLLYADQRTGKSLAGSAERVRFVFLGKSVGGTLKQTEDEHSIRAGWFTEEELERLDLRSPFVLKMVDLYRADPAVLPMAKFHMVTPEELPLERP